MGAAAVRGTEGVVDTTRLLRKNPFGEWVNVFYDPEKVKPAELLALIVKNDCPRAAQTKAKNQRLLNPFIAPGDPVQIRISAVAATKISAKSELPTGWKFSEQKELVKGDNIVTVIVPRTVRSGSHDIQIVTVDGQSVQCSVTVVDQVGTH